jgi:hypothetical protein
MLKIARSTYSLCRSHSALLNFQAAICKWEETTQFKMYVFWVNCKASNKPQASSTENLNVLPSSCWDSWNEVIICGPVSVVKKNYKRFVWRTALRIKFSGVNFNIVISKKLYSAPVYATRPESWFLLGPKLIPMISFDLKHFYVIK